MGYYTTFYNCFDITPALKPEHREYLKRFSAMCHYRYDEEKLKDIPDPVREAAGLPIGPDGAFSVVVDEPDDHWSVDGIRVDPPKIGERPGLRQGDVGPQTPRGMPNESVFSFWNVPDDEDILQMGCCSGDSVKAYGYKEWLEYYVQKFFHPWGYKLNGEMTWEGEDRDDLGKIEINDNQIIHYSGVIDYRPHSKWSPYDEEA